MLFYSIDIYDKDNMSKIDMTQNLINSLAKLKIKVIFCVIVYIVVKLFSIVPLKLVTSIFCSLKTNIFIYPKVYDRL